MLTIEEVLHIAKLARLDLTYEETQKFQAQLSEILDYVKQLESVDTTGVIPTSHAVESIKNRFQDFNISTKQTLSKEKVLKNAPDTQNGYIRTEAVL